MPCGQYKRKPRLHPHEKGVSIIQARYRSGAPYRGIPWNLNDSDVAFLITQNCYYCGSKPNQQVSVSSQSIHTENGERFIVPGFFYNGIDRVDNTIGYELDNCVTCCGDCNRMKGVMSPSDFIAKCKKIFERSTKCL